MQVETKSQEQVVLVTGPSGAGRSTAINVLEDIGFETIDNLPLRLWPRLQDGPVPDRPLALGRCLSRKLSPAFDFTLRDL